jgi:phage terminase large subunit-like protein
MTEQISPAQILASLDKEEREKLLANLPSEVLAELKYNWRFWARPNQIPPEGEWTTWLILAGRGFGKSRCGAEWVGEMAKDHPGCRIAIVGETYKDVRKTMIEGESGILTISHPNFMPEYSPANGQLTWPNGSMAFTYNATQPDQLRGPQHHFAWSDEIAKWDRMQDSWDQLQFGLRLGKHPKQVVTTTPRPLKLIRKLVADPDTFVTRGSTRDNEVNLAAPFIKYIEEQYGGTRLGRQELEGEILDDMPGALWTRDMLDENRRKEAPDLDRIVIAVDPATTSGENADETGIVAVGVARDEDGIQHGYVLADRSMKGTPDEWATAAVKLYRELDADRIVAEKNQGGEMVSAVLRSKDRNVPVTLVTATRGKVVRAEPIAALYEQGRVYHVGRFDQLEDQMCLFTTDGIREAGDSPDRVDALVWGLTSLFDRITGRRKRISKGEDGPIVLTPSSTKNNPYRGESDTGWMA